LNIEIRGVGFSNKGSELMLAAIVERLGKALPAAKFVVAPHVGPYEQRARYGLFQKLERRHLGRLGWLTRRLLRKGHRRNFGLLGDNEIDTVLDASGFALGDAWPIIWIEQTASEFERLRCAGVRLILLPQAFGPFDKPDVREAAQRALRCADLIFARDPGSYRDVRALLGKQAPIFEAPDFTAPLSGLQSAGLDLGDRPCCIVPNSQILRHGSERLRDAYVPFLVRCAEDLQGRGFSTFLLVHESKRDPDLALQIADRIDGGMRIINGSNMDARSVKGLIGRCALLIGSRFHSLVSAMSQGVPSIGTSWSHKYQFLFASYARPEWLVDPVEDDGRAISIVDSMLQNYDAERLHLLKQSAEIERQTEHMWLRVESSLRLQ
jgi:polysaccharide pyruvyl transferase WcaK-like protein